MADDTRTPRRGPSDPADYSSTKAPETRQEAEERQSQDDTRLHPGGAHPSPHDPGMSSLDRDVTPSGGRSVRP
jgi:hypothetical protein